jgi:hypothetical protein
MLQEGLMAHVFAQNINKGCRRDKSVYHKTEYTTPISQYRSFGKSNA